MAGGDWKIFYIDNPAIPVQCFCGMVIYIRHLFNHSIPLYQDVLLHPESYIYTLCVTISILYALVTWATGRYVFKRTGNLVVSLLFQLTPVISTHGILTTGGPSPESFYVIAGMFFVAYLYCNTIFPNSPANGKIRWEKILIYGAFTGFFVSCKYICFPFIFLVLFVLPTTRSRMQYLCSFFIFLFVFMSPAIPAWRNIKDWLFNLATHTGHYGQGDKGFINSSEFLPNVLNIFKEDFYFTVFYIVMIISIVIALIKYRNAGERNKTYTRLLCGVGVSSFILILLVAKHYSFHYLISVRLCYPLMIIGSYHVVRDELNVKFLKNKSIVNRVFYILSICIICIQLRTFISFPPQPRPGTTAEFLGKYRDEPIIMSADFESSRIEPSLSLGAAYTGDYRNHYWEFLKKIYPNTYQYRYPQEIITQWDDVLYSPELIGKYPKAVVYFIQKDLNTRNAILNNLTVWGKDTIANFHLVYGSIITDEYVYELDANGNRAKTVMANWNEVHFDMEKFTSDQSKFISIEGKDTAQGAERVATEEHHSGNNSILMNWDNQYGLNYSIRAFPGNIVVASIWRKTNDGKGCIVFSSKTDGDFYMSGQTVVDSDANGWKQIQYKCLVPPAIKDSSVFFYVYYYGHERAYFDDLSVRVYPMKK